MKGNAKSQVKKYFPSIVAGAVCLIIIICLLVIPNENKEPKTINLSEYSSVNTICELATLRSFYHNVAMYEKEPDGGSKFVNDVLLWPFGGYTKIGYKQFWLEYSGIVEIGIDASKIKINGPDSNGIVEVYIPEAKVFSVYADESSLTEPLSENGWFTTISGKEKAEAFATAQSAMKQEAENDQSLLRRSKENAKLLLERYIINTGKQMGTNYIIKWIDTP
ncbi:MAG: DUF4230 domain-containing protein [Clostridiales bacterium]|nr:DUF4230 domain-containing protein [Clostridiales bacterium]MDD7121140.1 DUF4230 domain-containing protein [Clostridiales bacterium]MDY5469518.1 DUF4230 domain-containing protein [Eubacteriales bacterium]